MFVLGGLVEVSDSKHSGTYPYLHQKEKNKLEDKQKRKKKKD